MLANIFTLLLCIHALKAKALCFLLNAKQSSELNSDISYILRAETEKLPCIIVARKVQGPA